jgi:DNA-binding winged helix-turn-helix (wHTH) protein/TolB-like protein
MRFAGFEVDERAGTLTRDGVRIKLQDLPFRLLVTLLKRPGDVVTREELRAELWGSETFVDAEAGLNTAIAKIREALGDNADTPVFIETLPRRGYRFIAMPGPLDHGSLASTGSGEVPRSQGPKVQGSRDRIFILVAISVALLIWAINAYTSRPAPTAIAVVRFHNETGNTANDRLAGTLTDAVVVSLAENPAYGVIGNSPLLVTDRIFQDVGRIGAALNAEYVVLGQLEKGDNGLVTRAHFIRVSDQKHLWAGTIPLPDANMEQALTRGVTDGVGIGMSRARQGPQTP